MSDEDQEKSRISPSTRSGSEEPEILSPETEAAELPGSTAPLRAEIADLQGPASACRGRDGEHSPPPPERDMADARAIRRHRLCARPPLGRRQSDPRARCRCRRRRGAEPSVAGLFSGVEMTEREFQRARQARRAPLRPQGRQVRPAQGTGDVRGRGRVGGCRHRHPRYVQPGLHDRRACSAPGLVGVAKAPPKAEAPTPVAAPWLLRRLRWSPKTANGGR